MTQYREKKIYTTQGHCHCDSLTMQRCALLPNNYINCPSGAFFSQISTSEVPEQLGAAVRRGGGSAVGDQTELHSETDHPNHHHLHLHHHHRHHQLHSETDHPNHHHKKIVLSGRTRCTTTPTQRPTWAGRSTLLTASGLLP